MVVAAAAVVVNGIGAGVVHYRLTNCIDQSWQACKAAQTLLLFLQAVLGHDSCALCAPFLPMPAC